MKLKAIGIFLLLVMALLSGCASFSPDSGQSAPRHQPPPIDWTETNNLSVRAKDFRLDVLQIIITPEYIMLISAVSGDLGINDIKKVDVLDGQQQPHGQTRVTTIREFKQGKLIALTYYGSRQSMSKPLFSVTGLAGKGGTIINGDWHLAPLELSQGAEDSGGWFASGVESAKIGAVTIFSPGNHNLPSCKGAVGMGGWKDVETALIMTLKENSKDSCIFLFVSANGDVREVSQEEYLLKTPIPNEAPLP